MTSDQFGIINQALNNITKKTTKSVARVTDIIVAGQYQRPHITPSTPNPPRKKPSLFVWRKDNNKILEMIGYLDMPLFIGDVISPVPNTEILIQFLLGGRANVKPESLVQIVSEKDVRVIRAAFSFAELTREQSTIQIRTAGGVTGIRG